MKRNILALVKEGERYIFLFDEHPDSKRELQRILGKFEGDKELSLNWYDATVLSRTLKKIGA